MNHIFDSSRTANQFHKTTATNLWMQDKKIKSDLACSYLFPRHYWYMTHKLSAIYTSKYLRLESCRESGQLYNIRCWVQYTVYIEPINSVYWTNIQCILSQSQCIIAMIDRFSYSLQIHSGTKFAMSSFNWWDQSSASFLDLCNGLSPEFTSTILHRYIFCLHS